MPHCGIVCLMENLLTTAQVAEKRGVSPSAISQAVSRGDLQPAFKLPGLRGAFLFDPSVLLDAEDGDVE